MRLAFISHEFPPLGGGAASALERFTRVLAARGHEILIITIALGERERWERDDVGRRVVRLAAGRRTLLAPGLKELLRTLWALRRSSRRHVAEFGPSLLVAWFAFPAGLAVRPLARRLRVPWMVSLRGSDVPGFSRGRWGIFNLVHPWLVRPVLRGADRVVANGAFLSELAQAFLPGLAVTDLPNGIDLAEFNPAAMASDDGPLRILFVGQLIPRKRCLELVDALVWLDGRGVALEATLAGDGPLLPMLMARVKPMTGSVRVHLSGARPREEMPGLMASHHVLVQVSRAEGVSNVMLEGLAAGLAVVASRAAAGPELAASEGVWALDEVTPEGLGEVLERLAGQRAKVRGMQTAARKAAEGFDWQRTAERFEELAGAIGVQGSVMPGGSGRGPGPGTTTCTPSSPRKTSAT